MRRHETSALAAVNEWNRRHQIGTPVMLQELDACSQRRTITRTPASLLDGQAVIWVEGDNVCWPLARVRPA